MTNFTDKLAQICQDEYERWDNGAGRETWGRPQHAKDYYLFVKEYWQSIGNNNLDGRTVVKSIRPAWSSAFVSHCVKKAGAGSKFKYTEAHCHYTAKAMTAAKDDASTFGYVARRTKDHKPKIGDIVVAGREYAKRYDYDEAALIYEADSFYPSHGDIVVEVLANSIKVIGGNVTNNVGQKTLKLRSNGYLADRVDNKGNAIPWIAILACRL